MSHPNPAPLTPRQAAALARSAGRELCYGLPAVRRELRPWNARAHAIPDPALRAVALQGLRQGRALVDGAAFFWTIPRHRSRELLRTLVALQTLLNVLDVILERDARSLGQPRFWTWLVGYALDANAPRLPAEVIADELGDDGGYLSALVATCQAGCRRLPSYDAARDVLLREARRATSFEIEHEPDRGPRSASIERWAKFHLSEVRDADPWELVGGASSLLSAIATLATAAIPGVDPAMMRRVAGAYARVGAAAALLDSYSDLDADAATGAHNWFAYYDTTDHAIARAATLLRAALDDVRALPVAGERHVVIVASMAALGLSADGARRPERREATRAIALGGGSLTRLLVPVLRLWRLAYQVTDA